MEEHDGVNEDVVWDVARLVLQSSVSSAVESRIRFANVMSFGSSDG